MAAAPIVATVPQRTVLRGTGAGLRVRWLGTVPYREAWTLQQVLHADPAGSGQDRLLLLEHPPTYTLGRNADLSNVLVDPAEVGAEMVEVDRGGDVTFHGPGQLVAYPILTLPTKGAVAVACPTHRGTSSCWSRCSSTHWPRSGSTTSVVRTAARVCGWSRTRPGPARSPPSGCASSVDAHCTASR